MECLERIVVVEQVQLLEEEIIEEIPQYKVNKIANEIAIRITNVFTELKDQHDDLLKKLEQCKIKIAKFKDENISHYYSNGVIYFSNKIHTNSINEILVIEYLHFLQDGRDQTCFQESLNNFAAKLLTQELKERMADLVSDLLTLSRYDTNRMTREVTTFDLGEIAKKCQEKLAIEIEKVDR